MSEPKRNPHAVALGKLGKNCPKCIKEADRAARINRLEMARAMLARIRAGIPKKTFTP